MKNKMNQLYLPDEDSELLLKETLKFLKKNNYENKNRNIDFLEVGIGSGYISTEIARRCNFNFYGTDINPNAISATKKKFNKINKKITLAEGNLFSSFKNTKKFDIIIFNPPYLPNDYIDNKPIKDNNLYGGKKGIETTINFIEQLKNHLKKNGICFLIVSTLSKYNEILNKIIQIGLDYEIMNKKELFFEEILCLKINNKFLNKIKNINNLTYYNKGKHSIIYKGTLNNKEVIIKKGKKEHISKEIFFLEKLKNYKFVPRIYYYDNNKEFIVMEFIKGKLLENFLIEENKKKIIKILNNILDITYTLDTLNINKFELTNPRKHIFIKNNLNIKFIDFERSIYSKNPKNTRQFIQYLVSKNLKETLAKKEMHISKKKVIELGKELKKKIFKINIQDLL